MLIRLWRARHTKCRDKENKRVSNCSLLGSAPIFSWTTIKFGIIQYWTITITSVLAVFSMSKRSVTSVLIPDWSALFWANTGYQNKLNGPMCKIIPSLIFSNSFKQVRVMLDAQSRNTERRAGTHPGWSCLVTYLFYLFYEELLYSTKGKKKK